MQYDYKIVSADDVDTLAQKVNAELSIGWSLCGGVSVAAVIDSDDMWLREFYQALVYGTPG